MLGRARVKRICQAALGALIDPKKATYDLVKDETGELFDRWFPDKSTPQQQLLKAVLRDVSKAYPDQALSELLTKKAQALLAMHGLSREELAGPGVKLDAQRAVERVCARGLKIMQPGLHEANRSFDGRLPPIEIEASIEQPLRQLVWSFYDSLIKNFDEELQVAIFGRTLDLLEGIDRKLDSLTRPAEGPAPPFSIPQPVGDFKGYEDEIAAVQAALAEGSALISAVQGIGGVGKTELAREVARRMRGDFPDGQILVDMLGTTQPREARDAMTDVLVALGAEDVRPATLAAEYHSRLAGKRVLILLDNVASGAGLQELVPPPPAALLVTSRTRFAMAGVVPVELEKLSREAAKALLGGIVPGLDDPVLDALAGLCADLPLALRVAGAYLQETGYPVDAYIAELKERRLARLARSATATEDARLDPEVVLGHSYDRLVEADAGLARAFTLLGVFPADFELAGAAAVLGMEPDAARERLTLLRRRSLVQQPEGGARWRLHDLLRELAVKPAEPGEHEDAAARHRSYYLALLTWCANEFNNVRVDVNRALATFEAEQPNVTAAIDHAIACKDLQPAALARLATDILDTAIGRREEALQAIQDAVDLYRRLAHDRPGDFNHSLALSLNNLGTSLNALGRREDALSATEEAVAIRRRLARDRPDAFNPELAASVDNLGIMLNALGRREDALRATEEAVGLYRRLARDRPDAFNPDLATSVDNLGNMLNALGRREDALGATEEAVAIRRRLARDRPDAFNPVLATLLYNLSLRLDALDRFDEAQTRNIEAIEALRPTFLRHPQAVIHWMGPMCQQYIERCQKLGVEPDAALLGPIVEVFERLKSEAG